eukprot:1156019-Pelagomonas_calceolata.AAC.2
MPHHTHTHTHALSHHAHSQPKDLASLLDISEADARRLMDREPALPDHSARRLKRTLKELTAALHVSTSVLINCSLYAQWMACLLPPLPPLLARGGCRQQPHLIHAVGAGCIYPYTQPVSLLRACMIDALRSGCITFQGSSVSCHALCLYHATGPV